MQEVAPFCDAWTDNFARMQPLCARLDMSFFLDHGTGTFVPASWHGRSSGAAGLVIEK